jgi:uncharacterized membrane protein YgaE (UPF0421/DUF939 family)
LIARVRSSFWPAVQAALAAAIAWWFAHRVLGHPKPFFAPIAAAISLSTSHTQRSRRSVQMVTGVLLGISVAEVLTLMLGTGTVAIGVVVLATMLCALLLGAGFVGEGMMFVNQATASAVLVVALHGQSIAGERLIDAVIGGAVALVLGVGLFPAHPLPRLRSAERSVLGALATALDTVIARLQGGDAAVDQQWTLRTGFEIHGRLGELAMARATARNVARIAPRRWHLRGVVASENERIAQLDLLANAILSLVRATSGALDEMEPLPPDLTVELVAFAAALRRLADAPQPWPPAIIAEVDAVAAAAITHVQELKVDRAPVIRSIIRSGARDVQKLIRMPDPMM